MGEYKWVNIYQWLSNQRENIVLTEKLADEYLDKPFSFIRNYTLNKRKQSWALKSQSEIKTKKMALKSEPLSWKKDHYISSSALELLLVTVTVR